MKKTTVANLAALLFLVITAGAFYYIWSSENKNSAALSSADTSSYAVVDISGIKDEATKITSGLENNGSIPIETPTSKLGKTNPFNAPE